jgi:hypothetical protein
MFFPSAVSAAALSFLFLRAPRRVAPVLWSALLIVWGASLGTHWSCWLEGGAASKQLIRGLTEASLREGVSEIVIANQPYRVAGTPVNGDLNAAVRLSGGRNVRIVAATSLDLPRASSSGIDGNLDDAVDVGQEGATISIRVPRGRFSRIFLPLDHEVQTTQTTEFAKLEFHGSGDATITIPQNRDATRAALVWYRGELSRLF